MHQLLGPGNVVDVVEIQQHSQTKQPFINGVKFCSQNELDREAIDTWIQTPSLGS